MPNRNWQRALDAKAATVKVRCNTCNVEADVLETNVGVWKLAHMHRFHFGHSWSFSEKRIDETVRPLGVEHAERERAETAGSGPSTGVEGVAQRSPEPVASPRPSYASLYAANQRRHGTDGQFVSRAHVQRFDGARRIIRDSNESGGAA